MNCCGTGKTTAQPTCAACWMSENRTQKPPAVNASLTRKVASLPQVRGKSGLSLGKKNPHQPGQHKSQRGHKSGQMKTLLLRKIITETHCPCPTGIKHRKPSRQVMRASLT
nr:hypothetical protein [Photorhabdus luminescens]